jgi:hypothetical protein
MNILINSKNRKSGTSSNFIIRSNEFIEGRYLVKNITLSNSFFIIGPTNNSFQINGINLLIPDGSYNLGTIINAIQTLLNNTFGIGLYLLNINSLTGRISLSGPVVFTLDFSSDLNYLLGFALKNYAGNITYIAENFSNISKLNLGIFIKEADQSNSIHNFSDMGINATLFFKTISNFGDILTQTSKDIKQIVNFPTKINQLSIKIIDLLTGSDVNLNNSDFEILLQKY